MIRVGRMKFQNKGAPIIPRYDDFTKIVVLMNDYNEWSTLGPYDLVNENGVIMKNFWQFSKVYNTVPGSKQTAYKSKQDYRKRNKSVVWDHPAERHVKDGVLTKEHHDWRKKGFENDYAVRYPVGFKHRSECKYALASNEDGTIDLDNKLDYVASRKKIYVNEYCRLVWLHTKFTELKNKLDSGENLLIIEVDGPHQESIDYYMKEYGVDKTFIEDDTMIVNEENIRIMLNDTKHAFGHGYCLAMAFQMIMIGRNTYRLNGQTS
jgi:hypothetical protein